MTVTQLPGLIRILKFCDKPIASMPVFLVLFGPSDRDDFILSLVHVYLARQALEVRRIIAQTATTFINLRHRIRHDTISRDTPSSLEDLSLE